MIKRITLTDRAAKDLEVLQRRIEAIQRRMEAIPGVQFDFASWVCGILRRETAGREEGQDG